MTAFDDFFAQVLIFINVYLIQVILAVAFLVFFWGLYQYFIQGGADEEKRKQGRQLVIWGVVGFFLMVSLWGIVNLLTTTFDLRNTSRPSLPSSRGGGAGGGGGGGQGAACTAGGGECAQYGNCSCNFIPATGQGTCNCY